VRTRTGLLKLVCVCVCVDVAFAGTAWLHARRQKLMCVCGSGSQIRRGSTHDSETTLTSVTHSHNNVLLEVLGTQSDAQDAQNQVPTAIPWQPA
jgi:hypothetical protein